MAKAPTEIKSLARAHTGPAINTLAGIMNQKKAPPAARVAAATSLLDRGWGKPAQALQIKGDPDSPVIFNLRLGDGLTPKTIDHVPDDPTEPLVAITYQDEESQPE